MNKVFTIIYEYLIKPPLTKLDEYVKLILTSTCWPAVVLIVSLFILVCYKEAVDDAIKSLESVSQNGIKWRRDVGDHKLVAKEERESRGPESDTVKNNKVALVSCKIASSLPDTIEFNFLRDGKVWFWIANYDPKKYRAYVKIKFITEGYEKELNEGYYGGGTAWNLNAYASMQMPGLVIPDEIKRAANQGKNIKIEINCTVKDENDKIVEKKLPWAYAYEYERNYWYIEPSQG